VLAGCGGGGSPTTTTTQPVSATAEELRWAILVETFVSGLLPDLQRLERLTGGSRTTGAIGSRLDPRIFRPGTQRQQFEDAMRALTTCRVVLNGEIPPAPTERLRPVRLTLLQACKQLELVPKLLRAEVLEAGKPADVDPDALEEAKGRVGEGVRSLVGSLATLQRLLGMRP